MLNTHDHYFCKQIGSNKLKGPKALFAIIEDQNNGKFEAGALVCRSGTSDWYNLEEFIKILGHAKSSQAVITKFYCTYCGKSIEAGEDLVGALAVCPSCGNKVIVPRILPDHKLDLVPDLQLPTSHAEVPESPARPLRDMTTESETNFGGKILSLVGSGILILVVVFLSRSCGGFIGKQAAERELTKRASTQTTRTTNDNASSKVDFEAILPEIVSRMNKSMPMTVDHDTRIDRVSSGPGRRITYHYSLTRLRISDFDRNDMITALRKQLISGYKNNPSLKYFKDNDVTLDYSYVDVDGTYFTTISVTPANAL